MTKFDRLKTSSQLVINFRARLQNDSANNDADVPLRFRVTIERHYETIQQSSSIKMILSASKTMIRISFISKTLSYKNELVNGIFLRKSIKFKMEQSLIMSRCLYIPLIFFLFKFINLLIVLCIFNAFV